MQSAVESLSLSSERAGRSALEQPSNRFKLGYRPSLDGLRGIAILLVIGIHTHILGDYAGFIGVDLFFVLSGFLITCLLVQEWDETKTISFRKFYLRRALRLLPALIVLLAAFVLYGWIAGSKESAIVNLEEALVALFYYMNWARIYDWYRYYVLSHTWSLSIEEQFYLLWPLILFWMLRCASRATTVRIIFLGVFLSCLTRVFLDQATSAPAIRLWAGLDTRADSLLLGCGFGVGLVSGLIPHSEQLKKYCTVCAWISVVIILALSGLSAFDYKIKYFLESWRNPNSEFGFYGLWLVISLCAVAIIAKLVIVPGGILQRLMEWPVLVFVGRISYGLYLWHNPLILIFQSHLSPLWLANLVAILVTVPVTLLSFYFIEIPFLRMKQRFKR